MSILIHCVLFLLITIFLFLWLAEHPYDCFPHTCIYIYACVTCVRVVYVVYVVARGLCPLMGVAHNSSREKLLVVYVETGTNSYSS